LYPTAKYENQHNIITKDDTTCITMILTILLVLLSALSVEAKLSNYWNTVAVYASIGGFLFIVFSSLFIWFYIINGDTRLCACLRGPPKEEVNEEEESIKRRKSTFFRYTIFGGENAAEKSQINILNTSTGKSATNSDFLSASAHLEKDEEAAQ
jgi:hypothetical protein